MENQVKFKAKTDVPVLLIFFSRSEQFQSVFDEVKKPDRQSCICIRTGQEKAMSLTESALKNAEQQRQMKILIGIVRFIVFIRKKM